MKKPENLLIRRNRMLTALASAICLLLAAAGIITVIVAATKYPPESREIFIILAIGLSVFSFLLLIFAAANIRNLFFPYILTADEKGIYNYSGYLHFGFIKWEDIAAFGKDPAVFDVIDSEMPSIKIYIHNFDKYKSGLSFAKKWQIFWNGSNIKIYTLTSQIKRKQLISLLDEMLSYYGNPESAKVENGKQ